MNRRLVEEYLLSHFEDTNSEKDRLIKDMLIMIEFGKFEGEDEEVEEG